MYYYRIHGLNVASDYRLDAAFPVPAFSDDARDVLIHRGALGALAVETEMESKAGSGYFYRHEKTRGWTRAVGHGCFLMENGNEVTYQLKDTYVPRLVQEVLLCLCIPTLLFQRGCLMLHGSGLVWNGEAIVVSGESGAGKSTLSTAMLRAGCGFLADDTVVVAMEDGLSWAFPGFPQQKLTESAARDSGLDPRELIVVPDIKKEKYARKLCSRYLPEKQRLRALIVLQVRDVGVGYIKKITGNEKLRSLTDNFYHFRNYKALGLSKESFLESVALANAIEVYHLVRPPVGMRVEEEVSLVRGALSP